MAEQYEITLKFDHWLDLFQTVKFVRNKDIRRNNQANPFKGTCKVVLGDGIIDLMSESVLSEYRKGGG